MQLKELRVSVDVERDEDTTRNHPVTITPTGDWGPNGGLMDQVTGTVPDLMRWLSDVLGLVNEDILLMIPEFEIREGEGLGWPASLPQRTADGAA